MNNSSQRIIMGGDKMKRRSMAARVLTIILSVCMVFTMCPFISDGWNNSGHAEAATYTAKQLVDEATTNSYVGKGYFAVRKAMKKKGRSPLTYEYYSDKKGSDWCAWYVAACAKNAGLKKIIPPSAKAMRVDYLVKGVASAGGKITFVNKSYYKSHKSAYKGCSYNKSYKPRKGDIGKVSLLARL